MASKTVLVTGTSAGGIGSALVIAFQKRGLHVFATARTPAKAAHLASLHGVEIIPLDVTSPASMLGAVEKVKKATQDKGLDILVNNSGSGYVMPLLDASLEQGRQMFDVNFWGVLGMVQAFAPLMVEAGGTVVNISSVSGEVYAPWFGLYSASKAAITSASETLRLELLPLGVKVITAMVGTVDTNFFAHSPAYDLPAHSLYKPIESQIADIAAGKKTGKQMDVNVFAEQMVSDVLGGASGPVWRGNWARTVRFASSFLPTWMVDSLLSKDQGLDVLTDWAMRNKVRVRRFETEIK